MTEGPEVGGVQIVDVSQNDTPGPECRPTPETRRFLWTFTLNPSVSYVNFSVYLLAAALGICLFVFINSSQVLTDEAIYPILRHIKQELLQGFVLGQVLLIPSEELGNASGSLTFYDELVSIFAVWIWGIASDRIGRRAVYGLGFAIMALGLALFTYAKNLYPQLLLFRLVFALGGGAASSMMTAVLSDYASDDDRGKTSGLVGLVSGCGALIAVFLLLRLPAKFGDGAEGLRVTFWIAAGLSAAFACVLWICLQSKESLLKAPDATTGRKASIDTGTENSTSSILPATDASDGAQLEVTRRKSIKEIAWEGILASKDPRILLGYAGSFLARGDTIILTLFLPLWIYKYYIESGLCPNQDVDNPDVKENCREAYRQASILAGIAQTFALIGAPLFGWLSDRCYRPLPLLGAGCIGLASYLSTFLSTNPTSSGMYVAMCVIGFAEIGMVVGSLSLVTAAYVPRQIRGSVAGVSSFFGAVGILINTRLGGYLFDQWTSGAPFFIMFVSHVVFCLIAVVVIVRDALNARRERRHGTTLLAVMQEGFERRSLIL
ncbi:uncharacterized protein SPPG_04735 [Spizellomyces punctatus DAOM BR117]|uniref:Major facilitator superfamily (MFS) profile domain-containing protein n=1 Tax=Spizellomyces punctatus (strain DAOM BR117) TaxID=645134 RepID=A0A0L0HH61_SPIPD|nr:uncharacterized protein SPPG_04735 [Spizellomyces punctatus DAOM BR117]KND00412.1 hypothetical protein SPPG_04735 [Spizellomyces punctatus DAOM BR117]|eukprot:XP_016608451.1 hypothetical protein SPPG_04735 [Spizellomyces punctatus DAOM BR117]